VRFISIPCFLLHITECSKERTRFAPQKHTEKRARITRGFSCIRDKNRPIERMLERRQRVRAEFFREWSSS
jgi:hypothetical protein